MQKTKFSFEILIHDDASTDGTADIIRDYEHKYPELIFPIFQSENQYSKGLRINPEYQFPRVRGKYMAICEGDDYWTDPYKLQKQVDFLEDNPEYGLIHTDSSRLYQSTGRIVSSNKAASYPDPPSGYIFNFLLVKNFISTLTVVARTDIIKRAFDNLDGWLDTHLFMDYSYWLEISRLSKIKYLNEITAMYRVTNGSASRPENDIDKSMWFKKRFDIATSFISHYDIEDEVSVQFYNNYFNELLDRLHRGKNHYMFNDEHMKYYKPANTRLRLLKYMYLNHYPNYMYKIVELPYYIIRKARKIFNYNII